jgi:hypothetical protein
MLLAFVAKTQSRQAGVQREILELSVLAESLGSWFFLSFPRSIDLWIAGPEETKNPAGESPPPDSDPFSDAELGHDLGRVSMQKGATANG